MQRTRAGVHQFSSRLGRIALVVTRHLPERLMANPERVLINIALIALGSLALLPVRGTGVVSTWPDWFQLEWGVGMVLGGCAALHGYWTGFQLTERIGTASLTLGCALYATQALIALGGILSVVLSIMFYCVAAAKSIRLARSLSVTERIAQHLDRGDLDPPDDVGSSP